MASKTLTTIIIVFACIIMFPILIGLLGGMFGLMMGAVGAVFGIIAGVFGAIFGAISGMFGWIFGGCHVGFFHWNIFPAAILIIIVLLVAKQRNRY